MSDGGPATKPRPENPWRGFFYPGDPGPAGASFPYLSYGTTAPGGSNQAESTRDNVLDKCYTFLYNKSRKRGMT